MSLGHGALIVRSGLVLHLDAANGKSYPGSGTTWTDLSGNGYTGSLINGPLYTTNHIGAITLDGSNDWINVTTTSSLDLLSNFTIECAFSQLAASNPGPLFEKYNWATTNQGGWGLRFNGGSMIFFVSEVTSASFVQVLSPLSANIPYIVTAVCDGGPIDPTLKIYINGIINNSATISRTVRTTVGQSIKIGQRGDGSGAFNNSTLYSAKLYNRVLTALEITQNFNALRGRYGI